MKGYKLFRGLLKTSAIASIMFVMQACYGAPHPMEEPYIEDEEYTIENDTIQDIELETPVEAEAE